VSLVASGGEAVTITKRIVCKICGQFIGAYDFTAPRPQRFIVTLEPCDSSRSIHAMRPKTEEEFNHDHQETCETARDRD
jgi:hypothetical protein